MPETFARIRAAAVDGRAHNVFYRQTQLERLCKSLTTNITEVENAITEDYHHCPAEVAVEIILAVSAIRRDYGTLQPNKAHEDEYRIAASQDAPHHRVPAGIVYIEPSAHTLFYSTLAPLSAAIAAGNCVIVLLENNLRQVSRLLRRLLSSALDADTFAIAQSPIQDQTLLDEVICVYQEGTQRWPKANHLISLPQTRAVAVVDRTGDCSLAARELVAARFAFGGKSPYAPDVVLVNEFVKKDFLQAVIGESAKLGGEVVMNGTPKEKSASANDVKDRLDGLIEADPDLRIVLQESKMATVDLISRNREQMAQKIQAPILVVHAVRSLDDAIDLIGQTGKETALAAYLFANPTSAKYLAQFIDSAATFVNQVPRELLLGPAYPSTHPMNPVERYPVQLFSKPKPAFVHPPSSASPMLTSALESRKSTIAQKLLVEAGAPLTVMKRSEGGGVGFFEQGFLMNASLILVSIITVSGGSIYWFFGNGRRLW